MRRLVPEKLAAALRPEATAALELPSELLRESRHRVRVGATIGALGYAVFLVSQQARLAGSTALEQSIDLRHDVLGTCLCSALLVIAAIPSIRTGTVLAAALVTEFLMCALISIHVPWAQFVRTAHVSALTWVVPIVILFPLLVNAHPRISLAVSTLCVLTMPVGLWALASFGAVQASASNLWASAITGGLAVAIAHVAARTVHGAGRQVAAARRVGSYELEERLGQGGMGDVWKARHAMLARPAAVKLILAERMQAPLEQRDAMVKRFTREARVTASLRSPHTVQLFDFGASADGALYYAMELLDGLNAQHFVYRFGPLAPRRAVHWLRQVCHSLGEAHARGLVHRDIKPPNLIVCRFGREVDWVKVLDFGLTGHVVTPEDSGLTRAGARMGTPGYMAPEQIFGLPADARSDLYALGCVGWWLLSGAGPFSAASAGELMRLHAQSEPPPLSSVASQPVPERLEAVLRSCLAKDPNDRPTDADALSEQLAASLDEPPWSDDEAQRWWEQHLPAK